MKKKNKKVNNVLYALVYEFVLIPILAYVSYFIYTNFMNFRFMDGNYFLIALLLVIIIVLNLVLLYYIAYALTHIYNFDYEYQIVVGIIVIFIAMWFKVYYFQLESSLCSIESNSMCVEAMGNNKVITSILIFLVAYNMLYIPFHLINKRKGKKVKFSLK